MNTKIFEFVSNINIENPVSWKGKLFITLDIDWAHDDVIREVADIFISHEIKSTWFVTHQCDALDYLRQFPHLFELGIHPNFNPLLLKGSHEKGANADQIIRRMLDIIPDAKSVRSHSLTQNSSLTQLYAEHTILNELNMFIPIQFDIEVKPYKNFQGIHEFTHIWEDDVHMCYENSYEEILEKLKTYKGLRILDFHPIHIFTNQHSMASYNLFKTELHDMETIRTKKNTNVYGTKDFLLTLLRTFCTL